MKTIFLASVLCVFSGAALASHCPRDARAIEAALPKVNLTAEQKAEVEKLKEEGMTLHQNGDHRESERKLAEAMRVILQNLEDHSQAGM